MSWFKYIVGGGLGAMVGGPFGAITGIWLANIFTGSAGMGYQSIGQAGAREQAVFVTAMFSMLGKICKADGVVSKDEIDVIDSLIEKQLKFSTEQREFAIFIFNEAKDNQIEFGEYAKQYFQISGGNSQTLNSFLYFLCMICWADGNLHNNERALLEIAAREFKISNDSLDQIINASKAAFFGNGQEKPLNECYKILGCSENDDSETIKNKYRALAKKFHPDTIANKDVPDEFVEFAKEKFIEIKDAYDQVKDARNI